MQKKGFTLIELLVVIAIIGILSTSVMVSLGGARDKARDARIRADLNQLSLAMELDYSDDEAYSRVGGAQSVVSAPSKIPCSNTGCTAVGDGRWMDPVPVHPLTGQPYQWLNNGVSNSTNCSTQMYCAYSQLLAEPDKWFVISEKGQQALDYDPGDPASPNGGQCPCW